MNSENKTFLGIAIGWVLLVFYAILLPFAMQSIIDLTIKPFWTLSENIESLVIFVYGLAVVSFLGGTQIPAIFLKKKRFIIQFGFSALFGLMLLILPLLFNETNFQSLAGLKSFFLSYPIVALAYLFIPYFFMILIDFYVEGRLRAFSFKSFKEFSGGIFLHPKSTIEEIALRKSTLFSLVAVILVSIAWMVHGVVSSLSGFGSTGWSFLPFNIYTDLGLVNGVTLTVPLVLLAWLIISAVVHAVELRLGGDCCYSETAGLLGFSFMPSLVAVVIGVTQIFLSSQNVILPDIVYFGLGFLIPLVLWALALVVLMVRESAGLSSRKAIFTAAVAFLPLYILLTQIFL